MTNEVVPKPCVLHGAKITVMSTNTQHPNPLPHPPSFELPPEEMWEVTILNDDHNTYEGVARAIASTIPNTDKDLGIAYATLIDNRGYAVVWSGNDKAQAERLHARLSQKGLTMAPLAAARTATEVVVLNDDHNSFQGVTKALSSILQVNEKVGLAMAMIIDRCGKCTVWKGQVQKAIECHTALTRLGLTMEALRLQQPQHLPSNWEVILKNDHRNSTASVARSLAAVLPKIDETQGRAFAALMEAQEEVVVYKTTRPDSEYIRDRLLDKGLTAYIREDKDEHRDPNPIIVKNEAAQPKEGAAQPTKPSLKHFQPSTSHGQGPHEEPGLVAQSGKTATNAHSVSRVTNVEVDFKFLSPFHGWEKAPLVTLPESTEALEELIEHLGDHVEIALDFADDYLASHDDCNLTRDEIAAIHLYTQGWLPAKNSLYFVLNDRLRQEDRKVMEPFLLYFRLLMEGISKLPTSTANVWRGIRGNHSDKFVKGKKFYWWAFSSCTENGAVLESGDTFLGTEGERTLFSIDVSSGVRINHFSSFSSEEELLLLPGTKLHVKNTISPAPGLVIVSLEEVVRSPKK